MRRPSDVSLLLLVAATLAACPAAPTTVVKPATGRSARPAAVSTSSPGLVGPLAVPDGVAPPGTPQPPGPVVVPASSGPVALAPAALTGVVRAPAGILSTHGGGLLSDAGIGFVSDQGGGFISDQGGGIVANKGGGVVANNGGGLVANNGGGVVANNSGAYRLQALAESPVANAQVALFDAAGRVAAGPDGKPLITTTDAEGRYRFPAAPQGEYLVLRAALGTGGGAASALIAPAAGAAPITADVDLASTVVSGYIMARFVASQADPRATLKRLPADVEAETRTLAAGAIAGSGLAPLDLRPATVAAAGDRLRTETKSFDDQMKKVRELLIPAGQVGMGDGEPAERVALGAVGGLVAGVDGTTWILVPEQQRLWRLAADGIMREALGPTTLNGAVPTALAPHAGGVAVLAGSRVLAVAPDGAVSPLWDAVPRGGALAPGPDGSVWALVQGAVSYKETAAELAEQRAEAARGQGNGYAPHITGVTTPATLWELRAGAPAKKLRDLPPDLTKSLDGLVPGMGRDAAGHLVALIDGAVLVDGESYRLFPVGIPMREAWRFDPLQAEPELEKASASFGLVSVDATGRVTEADQGKLFETPATGAAVPFADAWEVGTDLVATRTAAGAWLVALNNGDGQLQRYMNGAATAVVGGATGIATGDDPNAIDLREVGGLAKLPTGAMAVLLASAGKIVSLGADKQVSVFSDFSAEPYFGSGMSGIQVPAARLSRLDTLRVSAGGRLAFRLRPTEDFGTHEIWTVEPNAQPESLLTTFGVLDFAWSSDDAVVCIQAIMGQTEGPVDERWELARNRRDDSGFGTPIPDEPQALVQDVKTQEWWVIGAKRIWKYPADFDAGGPGQDPVSPPSLPRPAGLPVVAPGSVAMDAQGRFLIADRAGNRVLRWDRLADKIEILAGPGGRLFTGKGVADGLAGPAYPAFGAGGELYVADLRHRQVKRLPASVLGQN